MFNQVEFVREKCKEKNIPISKLERDLGFANGFLNPKKIKNLSSERANMIANYLGISLYEINGQNETKKEPDKQALSDDELHLLELYRSLNNQGKEYIMQTIQIASSVYQKNNSVSDMEANAG